MSIVFPGQILGPAARYSPGVGTHLSNAQVCASLLGAISDEGKLDAPQPSGTLKAQKGPKNDPARRPVLSVTRNASRVTLGSSDANVLPAVDSTVLARVTRINPRQATVEILVVGDVVCADGFQGLVRVQDVRATEKDKVKIAESFRPGDVVRAVVISLGDQSNYYLSTASNLLGVIMATSDAGNAMYPVNWKEFRDPITGATENRKVAKPF